MRPRYSGETGCTLRMAAESDCTMDLGCRYWYVWIMGVVRVRAGRCLLIVNCSASLVRIFNRIKYAHGVLSSFCTIDVSIRCLSDIDL